MNWKMQNRHDQKAARSICEKLYKLEKHNEFLLRCQDQRKTPKFCKFGRKVKQATQWSEKRVKKEEQLKLTLSR